MALEDKNGGLRCETKGKPLSKLARPKNDHPPMNSTIQIRLTLAFIVASTLTSFAQFGTVIVRNFFPPNPIYDGRFMQPVVGPDYRVTLYYGASPESLSPVATTNVYTGSVFDTLAGTYNFGTVTVPPFVNGDMVYLQVRAWYPTTYASYEAAEFAGMMGDPSVVVGVSSVALTTAVAFPSPPPTPVTELGGFSLQPVMSSSGGGVSVTISPPEAASAGAMWRVDGGGWMSSGSYAGSLSAGPHTVSFSTISGWTTPTSQNVFVYSGQTTTTTGYYTAVPQTGAWTTTVQPNYWRLRHTATLLTDGKVLVAGGWVGGIVVSNSEVYNPVSPGWTVTSPMSVARQNHAATALPDGRVLVTGGYVDSAASVQASAELFNPTNGTWIGAGAMSAARRDHQAVQLPSGKVLIAGGYGSNALASSDLFDPSSGTWATTGSMNSPRYAFGATLLPNGNVLVAGGNNGGAILTSAELYDPSSGIWTPTGAMNQKRVGALAVLLTNGKVLVAGGYGTNYLASAELYDPATGLWSPTGDMNSAREWFTVTLLPDGKVLVAGGYGMLASAEIYNPATGIWTTTGSMNNARMNHTATLLPDGKVLVAGAGNNSYQADLYTPEVITGTPTIITPGALASGTVGQNYTQVLSAIGGTPVYNWTLTAGGLPPGLGLSPAGVISGLPQAFTNATFTLRATGNNSQYVTSPFSLAIVQRPSIVATNGSLGFTNGVFGLSLSGDVGQVVVLEGSSNYKDWVPIQTNTMGASPAYFSDPGSSNVDQRYYRARVIP